NCAEETQAADEIEIDMFEGKIINLTKSKEFTFVPFPPSMKTIIEKGGLKGWVLEKLQKR
ncbi:MAG: 3-isopropylmalate dehydratase small subunit, partial [Candidatus Zixiibacteriota bacterium]